MMICIRSLIVLALAFLTGCTPKIVKMYDGPDMDMSRIAIVKGIDDKIIIAKVDWKEVSRSFWSGYPNEVHILPGRTSVFVAYSLRSALLWSKHSLIEFNAEPGQLYRVMYRFWDKGTYFWLIDSKGNYVYKKDDLLPEIQDIVTENSNSFYKLDHYSRSDYLVSLVRQNLFEYPWSEKLGLVLISLGLQGDQNFNCDEFFSKLTPDQKKSIDDKFKDYPFICKDKNYTADNAIDAFKETFKEQIVSPEAADLHWAWYSATGNTDILKKILDNYLYVTNSCQECIQWSYRSIATHDKNVENYLTTYMKDKSSTEKNKLEALLPSKHMPQ